MHETSCSLPQGSGLEQCARPHYELSCDAPGCQRFVRLHVNGDPTPLTVGWGSLTFRAHRHDEVLLDFCPTHLAVVVLPWVTVLQAKESEAFLLGPPADDQDAPLPPAPRPLSAMDELDEADAAVLWATPAVDLSDSDVLDDLAIG